MCGRFASSLAPELIARVFRCAGPIPNTPPSWNVAPTQPALVVRRHPETGERRLDPLFFGLLPHFEIDPDKARLPINARAETVATSGMFRDAFAKRRSLVPALAFYEWQKVEGGKGSVARSGLGTELYNSIAIFAHCWNFNCSPMPPCVLRISLPVLKVMGLAVACGLGEREGAA